MEEFKTDNDLLEKMGTQSNTEKTEDQFMISNAQRLKPIIAEKKNLTAAIVLAVTTIILLISSLMNFGVSFFVDLITIAPFFGAAYSFIKIRQDAISSTEKTFTSDGFKILTLSNYGVIIADVVKVIYIIIAIFVEGSSVSNDAATSALYNGVMIFMSIILVGISAVGIIKNVGFISAIKAVEATANAKRSDSSIPTYSIVITVIVAICSAISVLTNLAANDPSSVLTYVGQCIYYFILASTLRKLQEITNYQ
ncbi:MAG: hypothetical protein K6F63_01430 [Lachnospiraceae bacterium]|nr:hypothetical protein [Lachnospiraceae bacterium]